MRQFALIILLLLSIQLKAHEGGHGFPVHTWHVKGKLVKAEFIKLENGKVWLREAEHMVRSYNLSDFTPHDQKSILKRHEFILSLNEGKVPTRANRSGELSMGFFSFLGILLVALSVLLYFLSNRNKLHLTYGVFGVLVSILAACSTDKEVIENPDVDPDAEPSLLIDYQGTASVTQGEATTIINENLYENGHRYAAVGTIVALDDETSWTVPAATNYEADDFPWAPDLSDYASAAEALEDFSPSDIVVVDKSGELITGYIFADNYFELYVNGVKVGKDAIPFTPFNSSIVQFRVSEPYTIAMRLVDWEENLGLGSENNNDSDYHPGDGGMVAVFKNSQNKIVAMTNADWKAQTFYTAPIKDLACPTETGTLRESDNCDMADEPDGSSFYGLHWELPSTWMDETFDHSDWPSATTYTNETIGVNNKEAYTKFADDIFDDTSDGTASDAQFIWSSNVVLDNHVVVRYKVGDSATDIIDVPGNDLTYMQGLFEKFSGVTISSDDTYFYVSSNGLPDHEMMTGITAWNEQVPIDQDYSGSNSWVIPLHPELAENPISLSDNLMRGAVAIAVNGIPIFNPKNNTGKYSGEIGELDQWGGHSGRADDYHYHKPPTHLQETVGEGMPIAYALDGFPVFGETNDTLDDCLGKFNDDGSYQYHTIEDAPYFMAKMRGAVKTDSNMGPENQIIPQATTQPVRNPDTDPNPNFSQKPHEVLITNFASNGNNSYSMTYTEEGEEYTINYSWDTNGLYTYQFIGPNGTETYNYQRRGNQ